VLGEHDLVLHPAIPLDGEGTGRIRRAHMLTGISFTTAPEVDVEQFDRMISEIKNL
jgi:hypothetical protein